MGLRNFFIKRAIKRAQAKSSTEQALDDYIKDAMKRHAEAQRTAEKMLKMKLLDKQTKDTLSKLEELDDDEEEEEEEEESDFGDKLLNNLVNNFIKGKAQSVPALQNNPALADAVSKLTPEEIEKLKKKYLS